MGVKPPSLAFDETSLMEDEISKTIPQTVLCSGASPTKHKRILCAVESIY